MARCTLCKGKVGWFSRYRQYHEECLEKAKGLLTPKIRELVSSGQRAHSSYTDVQKSFIEIASQSGIPAEPLQHMVLDAADELAKETPLDRQSGFFLEQLCRVVLELPETIDVSALVSSGNPLHVRMLLVGANIESSVDLWNLMHGYDWNPPTRCPLVLQPGEKEVTRCALVIYQKSVMTSPHMGGYKGFAIRVASGVYYRFGGYSGQSLNKPTVQQLDSGQLYFTNKAIYFAGQQQTFCIPYHSILRFKAYPDGLGFFRSTGDGREEIFTVINVPLSPKNANGNIPLESAITFQHGWFIYNVAAFSSRSPELSSAPSPTGSRTNARVPNPQGHPIYRLYDLIENKFCEGVPIPLPLGTADKLNKDLQSNRETSHFRWIQVNGFLPWLLFFR